MPYRYINFQYFFFNTYAGYFLQVVPAALLSACIYLIYKTRKGISFKDSFTGILFSAYFTGLLSLTLTPMHFWGRFWYWLFYGFNGYPDLQLFTFQYDLIPDFFARFSTENFGNLLMFVPFGILLPLWKKNLGFGKTVLAGFLFSLTIELIQPIIGRAFDINDIILNTLATVSSAGALFIIKRIRKAPVF